MLVHSGTTGDSTEQSEIPPDPSTPKPDEIQPSAEKNGDADLANDAPNLNTIDKKERDDPKVEARGSEFGRKNVTHVTRVTHVTHLEYRCLLGDDIRWRMLETDLKKTVAEERDEKMARMREETRTAMAALNISLERHIHEARMLATEEQKKTMAEIHEARMSATKEQEKRMQDLDDHLALELQIMEFRGFMKIDTFGPVLLGMGAMQLLLLFCISLLFMRRR